MKELEASNAEFMLTLLAAIERRDRELIQKLYHPNIEFHWPPGLPYSGVYEGSTVAKMQKRFGLEGLSRERTAPCTRHADGASVELIAGLGRAWPSTGKLNAYGIDQSVAPGSSWAHLVAQMIHVAVGVENQGRSGFACGPG